jgi:hypothetical protein
LIRSSIATSVVVSFFLCFNGSADPAIQNFNPSPPGFRDSLADQTVLHESKSHRSHGRSYMFSDYLRRDYVVLLRFSRDCARDPLCLSPEDDFRGHWDIDGRGSASQFAEWILCSLRSQNGFIRSDCVETNRSFRDPHQDRGLPTIILRKHIS